MPKPQAKTADGSKLIKPSLASMEARVVEVKTGDETVDIKTEDYNIWHDPENSTIFFRGFLRLDGMEEYQPVMDLLLKSIEQATTLTLNLRELEFLNSSGISMLSMFVVRVRQQGDVQLVLQGSDKILWQTKSLKNLQRLMPSLTLEFS